MAESHIRRTGTPVTTTGGTVVRDLDDGGHDILGELQGALDRTARGGGDTPSPDTGRQGVRERIEVEPGRGRPRGGVYATGSRPNPTRSSVI